MEHWERGLSDGSSGMGSDPGTFRTRTTSNRSRRDLLRATAGSALGVSLAGCMDVIGSSEATEDRLRIGVLAPDPGRSPIGASIAVTARFFGEYVNQNFGGLAGHEVDVIVEDTKSSPLEAQRAYERLILDENVDLTVGISESAVLEHLIESIADHETVHISTGATSARVSQLLANDFERYRYHFRTMLNDEQLMEMELSFITEMLPQFGFEAPFELAVLAEGYRWADGLVEGFEQTLPAIDGFELAMAEQYDPEIDDFGPLYEEVEASDADMAWVGMAHTGDAAIIDWQHSQPSFAFGGTHVPMQWPGYWEMVDGACEYGISMSPAVPGADITDETEKFVEQYTALTDDYPVYTGYLTYDGLRMYADAVMTAGSIDAESVIPALESVEIEATMARSYTFGDESADYPHDPVWEPGDSDRPASVYWQWQDDGSGGGSQEVIWPEPYATGTYQEPPWM